jgi:hypothetical protein
MGVIITDLAKHRHITGSAVKEFENQVSKIGT